MLIFQQPHLRPLKRISLRMNYGSFESISRSFIWYNFQRSRDLKWAECQLTMAERWSNSSTSSPVLQYVFLSCGLKYEMPFTPFYSCYFQSSVCKRNTYMYIDISRKHYLQIVFQCSMHTLKDLFPQWKKCM